MGSFKFRFVDFDVGSLNSVESGRIGLVGHALERSSGI